MPRDNRCVYMAHVCFYVRCSDCVGVCDNVCCVAAVVKDSVFSLGMVKYVVCLCRGCDVMDVVFNICIVTRGDACARVWDVRVFRHADVYVLCTSCVSPQCCVRQDLQFNVGRGCMGRPYGN